MLDLNPQFRNQNPNHHANYTRFGLESMEEDSGVFSPPLWRSTSPPDSPVRFPNPRSLSPGSRAQAIARGQREMMEMVENMPETSYELSLKDMVEQRKEFTNTSIDHETQSMEEGEASLIWGGGQRRMKKQGVKRQESSNRTGTGRVVVKNGSMNQNKGLLINMFFPFSIGSNKKKPSNGNNSIRISSSGVKSSPKRELLEKSGEGDGRDWWKKFKDSNCSESLGVSSSSEGTGRSGSSGSSGSSTAGSLRDNSGRRENKSRSYGCWSLFPFRKKKS